jgi:putative membrane protein
MIRMLFGLTLSLPAAALLAGVLLAGQQAAAEPSEASRGFLAQAAAGGEFELAASEVALERGGAALQPLAHQLLADHATVGERLAELAAERGIELPSGPDASGQQLLDRLRSVPASEFDAIFLQQQQAAHESAAALFAGYASAGDDPALRAFAAEVLPTLNAHLDDIEALIAAQ